MTVTNPQGLRAQDSRIGLFNYNPAYLMKWRKALTNVRTGQANAKIALVGASTIRNAYAGTWDKVIQNRLAILFGKSGIQSNDDSFFGDNNLGSLANKVAFDPRLSFGNNWSLSPNPKVFCAGAAFHCTTSNSNAVAFTPTTSGLDTFDIYPFQISGSGATITVDWNGGNVTTISLNGATGIVKTTCPGTAGAYPINIKTTVAGTQANFTGGAAYLSTLKTVNILNFAMDGSNSGDWQGLCAGGANAANQSPDFYTPDLTLIDFDQVLNDLAGGVITAAQTQSNLQALITQCLNSGDVVLIAPNPVDPSISYAPLGKQNFINGLARTLASTNNLVMIDLYARFGSFTAMNSNGFYGDAGIGIHPNTNGCDDISMFLESVFSVN